MPVTLVRKATPSNDPITRVAEQLDGRIQAAFIRAVEYVRSRVDLKELADAIQAGDANQVLSILAIDDRFPKALQGTGLEPGIQSVRDAVQTVFTAAAKEAINQLPKAVAIELSFNLLNPEAIHFLNSYTFNLIQQITQETRDAIQQVVLRAFKEGGHPYAQAREIRDVIGLTARQEAAIASYRDALENDRFRNALNRALRDGRYDRSLLRAIDQGTSLDQSRIESMVERYRSRFVAYRAQTTARTESIRASQMGQRELWRQARDQNLLPEDAQRVWIASGDERTCPICQDLDGQTAGLDEEFDDGIMAPPDPHPDCRCGTAIVH